MNKPKEVISNGKTRYRVVVDAGNHADGRRRQICKTFDTKGDANRFIRLHLTSLETGTFTAKTKTTVTAFLDEWLAGREFGHENTRQGYRHDLKVIYDECGELPLQKLTPARLNAVKEVMRTTGGRSGKGRSVRTIALTFTVLEMALNAAVRQNLIPYNPATKDHVERPKESDATKAAKRAARDALIWSPGQIHEFLTHVQDDRFHAMWRLAFLGLRRSEVLGLTWADVDFTASTVSVSRGRTPRRAGKTEGPKTVVDSPKTANGFRVLPVPREVLDVLKAFKNVQRLERMKLGRPLQDTDFLVVDEVGNPISPEWYSVMFRQHRDALNLPPMRPHDARHATATLLHTEYGIPTVAAAAYLGHDPVTYQRVYVHGDKGGQAVADALSLMQTGTGQ